MSAMTEPTIAAFPGVESFNRRSKYRVEDYDTLQPGALTWRVKGLWPAVGVVFVGGPSMSGKSFWTLDALARVCMGEPVLGRKSIPAGVLYIAAEGAHGVKNRIAGLRLQTGKLGGAFKFIGQAPDLRDPEDVADLRAVIAEAGAEMAAAGHALGVVAVDTLSASIPGADENSAQDMSPVLAALQGMAAELGVVVAVVAHTGKDETRGLRGWSGLLGNADGLIMLETPDDGTRLGSVVKVKDGLSGDRFAFRLSVVVLDQDADGDDITTCTVEPAEAPAIAKPGRTPKVAEADATLIKQAYNRIFPEQAAAIRFEGADGAKGVEVSELRREALLIGVGPTEPDYTGMTDAERHKARVEWTKHRAKSFDRALERLKGPGGYRIENGWIWAVAKNEKSPA